MGDEPFVDVGTNASGVGVRNGRQQQLAGRTRLEVDSNRLRRLWHDHSEKMLLMLT